MKLVIAQIKMELTTLVRNYEQLLLVVVIPVGVLVFFGSVDVLPDSMNLERLVSSVLTLSLMSTAMVSTGIATGFERSYNVLKRLGVSPLGKRRLVWAKASAVATVEIGQVSLLLVIAAVMGLVAGECGVVADHGCIVVGYCCVCRHRAQHGGTTAGRSQFGCAERSVSCAPCRRWHHCAA